MTKIRSRNGSPDFSHGGVQYTADASGLIDIPPHAVADALGHNFDIMPDTPAVEPPPDPTTMKRGDCLAYLDQANVGVPKGANLETLRAMVTEHLTLPPETKTGDGADAGGGDGGAAS